jgi:hypothetical protein
MTARHRDGLIRHWSIFDGRALAGVVDLADDRAFVARTVNGEEIGRFDSLLLASRVFELVEGEQ